MPARKKRGPMQLVVSARAPDHRKQAHVFQVLPTSLAFECCLMCSMCLVVVPSPRRDVRRGYGGVVPEEWVRFFPCPGILGELSDADVRHVTGNGMNMVALSAWLTHALAATRPPAAE